MSNIYEYGFGGEVCKVKCHVVESCATLRMGSDQSEFQRPDKFCSVHAGLDFGDFGHQSRLMNGAASRMQPACHTPHSGRSVPASCGSKGCDLYKAIYSAPVKLGLRKEE